jgi:signal transduction histidine kinase
MLSLRVRLLLLIVALVTVVAMALSILHLNTLINSMTDDALDRSRLASQQVSAFIVDQINQHSQEYETPAGLDQTKALWDEIVASDRDIPAMLEQMLALSPLIVEINVAGQTGQILASSDPSRVGAPLAKLETFGRWRNRPFYERFLDVMTRPPDYQVTVPLGSQSQPVFIVQVVAYGVLLRSQIMPEVRWVTAVSGGALLVSLLLTAVATNWMLRPLKRIEQTIDRIMKGSFHRAERPEGMAKEFAAVESKLNVLGEQFRGVQEEASAKQHNLDQLLERMAGQLDVASRLTAISRITGGVAHEIKNPLNAISLRLDLLRARLGAPEEELTKEIDILSAEVRRLDRVVKTFLDFSRPVNVRLVEVDLVALTREVTDLMTPQGRLAGIQMSFEAPPDADALWIRGDADMLKQAVLNLVTNALDAMKSGGNLRVRVARAGDSVALEIADDGPGIPPELRDKVFQLYFTTKVKGSGIGLAMTYRAVQLHNGTIDFTSENGRGTTFRLEFPGVVGHA